MLRPRGGFCLFRGWNWVAAHAGGPTERIGVRLAHEPKRLCVGLPRINVHACTCVPSLQARRMCTCRRETTSKGVLACLTGIPDTPAAWAAGARDDYLQARDGFQRARGYRGRNGGTTQRLDGALWRVETKSLLLA